jgi:arsenate reductase (thioredoxin)
VVPSSGPPLRVLFVCTGNSARSQMAEAVLNHRGGGRFVAESAGSDPVAGVNPFALDALRDAGIPWRGHPPRGLDTVEREAWDIVITVCDHAREACPVFPGHPAVTHWGMADPAAVEGDPERKRRAFRDALQVINQRLDLLVAFPAGPLDRGVLADRLRDIASAAPYPGDGGHICEPPKVVPNVGRN